jgi:hypothetical protein
MFSGSFARRYPPWRPFPAWRIPARLSRTRAWRTGISERPSFSAISRAEAKFSEFFVSSLATRVPVYILRSSFIGKLLYGGENAVMEVSHRGSLGSAGLRPWALPGQRWIYTSRHFSWASRKIREDLHHPSYSDTHLPYSDTNPHYPDTNPLD